MIFDSYDYPLYRPPSEAYSLILQITLGCSHNGCVFCGMYQSKKFHVKSIEQVKQEMDMFATRYAHIDKIFLADGNALTASTDFLAEVLDYIKIKFPKCERVSCYATHIDIRKKSLEELQLLSSKGLTLLYIGVESGDDETLRFIRKGATAQEMITLSKKVKDANMKLSATFILGINGQERDNTQHAIKTGEIISKMYLDYVGLLTLRLEEGSYLTSLAAEGKYTTVGIEEVVRELKLILENIHPEEISQEIIFRSNHASNFLTLKGTLPQDRDAMLKKVKEVIEIGEYPVQRKYYF
ncbi:radical SAM protein [Fusobacterium necrophorum subsp. funduliforme]|uniref:B12-binding domain-containing radical SAM protein n=6 Tax=Fusobacterium necrophorum TaxID=859 RepID=A0A4Q2KWY7_9FUSO|nr:radical SAM protein [Fusobacterium necrophorum]AYV92803.1 radical SAM protein [Fusobacterium necrophorum subsp. funduliforme]AYV94878.1 radical SAM protein [Fusobacterium necrophorum subsp. funduliforme]AYZ72761.1 radical SAM protein [Fusobacterium necrophorum]AZW09242.1 B12-binding domain-containing radical SAM protein [Fusobacterium necrophorum subsp. necrophorum]EIJ72619.1 radical SAM domain protein [Fusobacterium necrophorum subsp. funduliforme ATCC 51357]